MEKILFGKNVSKLKIPVWNQFKYVGKKGGCGVVEDRKRIQNGEEVEKMMEKGWGGIENYEKKIKTRF